ncbi:MAG: sulfotransferase domain-containing protein [Pseudomonadaceae bacterium]|nr:sulfotransferase domain-containing protein [Pseudomonadaceae bacterium]
MKFHVVVATHHKSGTNWMGGVFQMIAQELGVPYVHLSQISSVRDRQAKVDKAPDPNKSPHIYFYAYGRFPKLNAGRSKFRGIHVVRDPRDMILSASKYHTWSEETWLHQPLDEFSGLTYQQKINSFKDPIDRLRFEMLNNSSKIIGKMTEFENYDCMADVRYEDMRRDMNLLSWHKICLLLGFEAQDLPACFNAFLKHSIQFGEVNSKKHIQDTAVTRWKEKFPAELLEEVDERFEGAIKRFGYEFSR